MNETESTNRSWIAGLMEYRVALGVAVLASVLLIVFMLSPSGNQADKDRQVAMPATANHVSSSNQAGAQAPTYSIPEKPANLPQTSANHARPSPAVPAPATRPVATPGKPVSATNQGSAPHTKAAAHGYFVQIGSYRNLANARKMAARMMQRGWESSITVNTAGLNTVRIGPVSTRSAAEKLRQRLLDKAKLKGFIVKE